MKSPLLKLAFVLCIPVVALAQDTGGITGTVRDNSGAVVPSAAVKISNAAGSLTRSTVTNSDGEYSLPGLPEGAYDLSISAAGFKTYGAKGIVLRVAQKARVDATLEVGAVSENVTVQGEELAQVQTQSSEVADTLTGTQINKLPMNGRVFISLVGLMAGVADAGEGDERSTGSFSGLSASINGGRPENNNWQLNGGDNQDTGSNGTLIVYPSVEAIGEVKVLESSYGAQYGKNGQGTIEVETKSGTKAFHGDVYYYGRNDFLNARNFFGSPKDPKPSYKRHDFGYTLGGPIFIPGHYNSDRSKSFFFFSQEFRRQIDPSRFTVQVPPDAERGGNFSDVCAGQAGPPWTAPCPSGGPTVTIDPNSALLLPLIPRANTLVGGVPFFDKTYSFPTTTREEVIDLDHNISSKWRASFRYIHDAFVQQVPLTGWGAGSFPTFGSNLNGPGISMVARLTAALSPTLFNEFILGYTNNQLKFADGGPWQRSLYPGLFTQTLFANNFGGKVSAFNVNDSNTGLGFRIDPAFAPWVNTNPIYSYRDNVSKLAGKHNLQFGGYLQASRKYEPWSTETEGVLSFGNQGSTVTSGNGFADFLAGNIASFYQESQQVRYHEVYKIFEPYFNDDWHVTSRLTLQLGLRMSLFGTQRELHKLATNFNPDTFVPALAPAINPSTGAFVPDPTRNPFNGIVQCGGPGLDVASTLPPGAGFPNASIGGVSAIGCSKGHLFNPGPRIGFAFDPTGKGKMSIRGGYGIFWEHANGSEASTEGLQGNLPYVQNATQTNISGYANIGGGGGGVLLFPGSPVSIPNQVKWPYVQQWHLDVQKEIPGKTVLTVAYVGSKGTHLTTQTDANQLHYFGDPPFNQPNPFGPGQTLTSTNGCANQPYSAGQTAPGTTLSLTAQTAANLNVACGVNPTVAGYRPLPGYNSIFRFEQAADASYNSLQLTARRTLGGLTYSFAYTYSHSIDDASFRAESAIVDGYFPHRARASSNFDQRHILNLSYYYELPFFKSGGLAHSLLGGWSISGITLFQTGQPFSVTYGNDNAGVANGDGLGSFLDLVPGQDPHGTPPPPSPGAPPPPPRPLLFNSAAFAVPRALTFGNSGRNFLNFPFRTNFDMGFFKSFHIQESKAFEFRFEGFNIFNHVQINGVDTNISDINTFFLRPTSWHSPRIMQGSLKFVF